MNSKYITLLITRFFETNLSKEVQHKFARWFVSDESYDEKQEVMRDVWDNYTLSGDEDTRAELKKLTRRISKHENRKRLTLYKRLSAAAAVLLLLILGSVTTYVFTNGKDTVTVKEPELVEYFVPRGERKHIILSDGSEVWLNAGSLLIHEKEFLGNTRTLFLNGEANFNVTPNPEKPFIVKTEYMDVTALGTVFNVQSYPDASKSTATLEEGKVEIKAKQNDMHMVVILSPNEELVYDRIADEFITRKVDASKSVQWIQDFLIFQGNSFEEIVQELERKFRITVQYDPRKFKGRTFTLRFSPNENVNQIFDVLKDVGEFKYSTKGNVIYVN
jgi:ferric-dicitrate binding protein FerR (iron transport regulator)